MGRDRDGNEGEMDTPFERLISETAYFNDEKTLILNNKLIDISAITEFFANQPNHFFENKNKRVRTSFPVSLFDSHTCKYYRADCINVCSNGLCLVAQTKKPITGTIYEVKFQGLEGAPDTLVKAKLVHYIHIQNSHLKLLGFQVWNPSTTVSEFLNDIVSNPIDYSGVGR